MTLLTSTIMVERRRIAYHDGSTYDDIKENKNRTNGQKDIGREKAIIVLKLDEYRSQKQNPTILKKIASKSYFGT